jgi:hypothetical protein
MLTAFIIGCTPDRVEPENYNILKYSVINSEKSTITINYVSSDYTIESINISHNWQTAFPVFTGEMYFISVESEKEITVKIYLNNEVVRISKGINIIDANYSL